MVAVWDDRSTFSHTVTSLMFNTSQESTWDWIQDSVWGNRLHGVLQREACILGGRDKRTNMWQLPINLTCNIKVSWRFFRPWHISKTHRITQPKHNGRNNKKTQLVSSLYILPYKRQYYMYMQQAVFSPSIQIINGAENNNNHQGRPCLI